MRREDFLYLMDKPLLTISLLFSSIPIWFVIVFAIFREIDLISTLIFLFILFFCKIYTFTESHDLNPFSVAFNTFVKNVVSISLQITLSFFIIILSILMAIGEKNAAIIITFILVALICVMIFIGNGRLLYKIWKINTVVEVRGLISSMIYNLMWFFILLNEDIVIFILGMIIAVYWNTHLYFKRSSNYV
ncbi:MULTISPECIES: hypothetical protein [Calditerrivibrio]|uniref:Uncharacterized protein n=1 Tax=Calditerrivibrio nitroreducens TaxID=477976 RepID=A0A2J6WKF9_9BACT|nr:MAG: hypothetical protein C0187_04875 [Calditerrivibrio nitroreducens]